MSTDLIINSTVATLVNLATQPLDFIKVQSQVYYANKKIDFARPMQISRNLISIKGYNHLYVGFEAMIIRTLVYYNLRSAIYGNLLESLASKDRYHSVSTMSRSFITFIASLVGGFAASPFDLMLLRKQVGYEYKGFTDFYKKMNAEKSNVFLGAGLNSLKFGTFALGMFPIYDLSVDYWPRTLGEFVFNKQIAIVSATFFGCLASMPFDNLKTKIQKQIPKTEYRNSLDCFLKTTARESWFGLYVGFSHYFARASINMIAISYLIDVTRGFVYN